VIPSFLNRVWSISSLSATSKSLFASCIVVS
jgi:hypothetical protein